MRLVSRGLLDIDRPVRDYLPELRLADEEAAAAITVRHLLTHSSGIDGDHFLDCGRGDDAIARYVDSLHTLPQLHAPGALTTYCNSGFVLAGRVAEVVAGTDWNRALRTEVLEPAGLALPVTLPEDALAHPFAMSHRPGADGKPVIGVMWPEIRSLAPAGGFTCTSVEGLLRFARLHIDGGRAAGGEQVVDAALIAEMQRVQVEQSPLEDPLGYGLSWAIHATGDRAVIGHSGGSSAFLRVMPRQGSALALLSNAPAGILVLEDVMPLVADLVPGIDAKPALPAPIALDATELERCAGLYRRHGLDWSVSGDATGLVLSTIASPAGVEVSRTALTPVGDGTFVAGVMGLDVRVRFLGANATSPHQYIRVGNRAARRVSDAR
jgi:CubicO group peptidase (beta-lactamase class C family)